MNEVLTGNRPYFDRSNSPPIFIQVSSNPNFRPTYSYDDEDLPLPMMNARKKYIDLMIECWAHDPQKRPNFDYIVDQLLDISKSF